MQSGPQRVLAGALAFVLWLVTAVVGLLEVYFGQNMLTDIYARFGSDFNTGLLIRNSSLLCLSLVWLAFVVGTGEYHRTRVGRPSSWRLFGWTIAVQVSLLALDYFL